MIERRHCCIIFIRLSPPPLPSKRPIPRNSTSRTLLGFAAETISAFDRGEDKEAPWSDEQPSGASSAQTSTKTAASERSSSRSSQESLGDDAPDPSSERKHERYKDWMSWSVRIVQLIIAPYGGVDQIDE